MAVIDQFGPVLAVFLILWATLWLLKRRGLARFSMPFQSKSGGRRRIELIERQSLTAQHSLHLVRVANRTMLIGVAPNSCQLLSDHVDEDAI